jgi:CRISPR-associated protein Cmr4
MPQFSLLFLSLIDPLHNGSGEGLGLIDRPIMREKTTLFPIIQPTSIKGVLRDSFMNKFSNDATAKAKTLAVFGPEQGHGENHSGAVSFGEGQILAFPVRALKGCFIWATSPLLLYRLRAKLSVVKESLADGDVLKTAVGILTKLEAILEKVNIMTPPLICQGSENKLLVCNTSQANQPENWRLMIEEFAYMASLSPELKEFAAEMADKLFGDKYLQQDFKEKLVVLPEDTFRYFVTNATEVMPNIRIGDNGTTDEGSLRYTEYLPRESVLFSLLIHDRDRSGNTDMNLSADIKLFVDNNLPTLIQIGGDATTGKGLLNIKKLG